MPYTQIWPSHSLLWWSSGQGKFEWKALLSGHGGASKSKNNSKVGSELKKAEENPCKIYNKTDQQLLLKTVSLLLQLI